MILLLKATTFYAYPFWTSGKLAGLEYSMNFFGRVIGFFLKAVREEEGARFKLSDD